MKSWIKFLAGVVFCLSLLGTAKAQDNGTYVDEVTVQDSTYVDDIFMDEEEEPASNNTVLYIAIAAVVVAGGAFFILRKKKK